MENNKKTLEEVTYNFQKKILKIFNEEDLPFLLKYYLFKDIWETIENHKFELDKQVRMNDKDFTTQTISIDAEKMAEQQK